jgi:hypothetical protein
LLGAAGRLEEHGRQIDEAFVALAEDLPGPLKIKWNPQFTREHIHRADWQNGQSSLRQAVRMIGNPVKHFVDGPIAPNRHDGFEPVAYGFGGELARGASRKRWLQNAPALEGLQAAEGPFGALATGCRIKDNARA